MANRRFTQFYNTLHKKPAQIDCSFVVASTDSGGLGVTGLVGAGVANVYMHTSSTPGAGSPNPAVGIILVKLQDNYNRYYFGGAEIVSPTSGSPISISTGSSLTAGNVYVITSLGTTTTANWVTVGVPSGVTPSVGLPFVAVATAGSGTGVVEVPANSGISSIEKAGNPNLSITSQGAAVMGVGSPGSYIILQCWGPTNSGSTTPLLTNPVDGTRINLSFVFSNSTLTVNGD